ncbi:glycine/betaine ABC transporter permease [Actinoplanes lobatus]|uniref:Glycine/betaine ABC transporter permease n=1 Tax=Actinoplanes lobatus TaxID=113568 RepID=A0A7W7ML19_9ACTN|nr:ABC transporter permease [Actinoplanes lobatus]MBB4754279.1 osmoprotectant transport system permease protein [Actinoplanes lobatus]GGN62258.1 glycine/betaine ABC transporter permease [Actinoplanes lobatus]GIE46055.1 glycine/betaine ABC transporter permease [Actinoplanes lobatus]
MIEYLRNNADTVWLALQEHVYLALLPVLFGFLIALPIGYLGVRFPALYHPLINTCGVLYSIPSLALFVFLPVVLGTKVLSPVNVVVALTIYTVALLARTVADGLRSVDPVVVQAATAMGYRRVRRLTGVELPMALPVILAGLRVATVSNISLVSVGALIGIGGLGQLFTRGFQLFYIEPILVGIVLSVLLAGLADLIIVLVQRAVTPWTRAV